MTFSSFKSFGSSSFTNNILQEITPVKTYLVQSPEVQSFKTTNSNRIVFNPNYVVDNTYAPLFFGMNCMYGGCIDILVIGTPTQVNNTYVQIEIQINSSGYLVVNCGYLSQRNNNVGYKVTTNFPLVIDGIYHSYLFELNNVTLTVTQDSVSQVFTVPYPLYGGTNYNLGNIQYGATLGYRIPDGETQSYSDIVVYKT